VPVATGIGGTTGTEGVTGGTEGTEGTEGTDTTGGILEFLLSPQLRSDSDPHSLRVDSTLGSELDTAGVTGLTAGTGGTGATDGG